jgi:hypothetical protein
LGLTLLLKSLDLLQLFPQNHLIKKNNGVHSGSIYDATKESFEAVILLDLGKPFIFVDQNDQVFLRNKCQLVASTLSLGALNFSVSCQIRILFIQNVAKHFSVEVVLDELEGESRDGKNVKLFVMLFVKLQREILKLKKQLS